MRCTSVRTRVVINYTSTRLENVASRTDCGPTCVLKPRAEFIVLIYLVIKIYFYYKNICKWNPTFDTHSVRSPNNRNNGFGKQNFFSSHRDSGTQNISTPRGRETVVAVRNAATVTGTARARLIGGGGAKYLVPKRRFN